MNCDVKTWHTRYLICDPCGVTPHRLRTAAVSRHKPSPFLSCFWPWPWSQQQNEARPSYNNQSPKWSWLVFTEQSCSGVVSWVRLLPRELTDAVRAVFSALTKAALCLVLICSCLFMWRAVVSLSVTPVIFVVFRFVPWFENIVECDPPCWAAAVLSSRCHPEISCTSRQSITMGLAGSLYSLLEGEGREAIGTPPEFLQQ